MIPLTCVHAQPPGQIFRQPPAAKPRDESTVLEKQQLRKRVQVVLNAKADRCVDTRAERTQKMTQ